MRVLVLGGGILGVASAWYLAERGAAVTLVDRQPGPALETSYANGAQISISYCEPWANAGAPLKVARWLASGDSPLLFRPRLEPAQWLWGAQFLGQCTTAAFERNVRQLVALGRYSHAAHKALAAATGISFHRQERGILQLFADAKSLDAGVRSAELMQRHGVARRALTAAELLEVEPALAASTVAFAGGIYTASDESGDAQRFTAELARLAQARGVTMRWNTQVLGLQAEGGRVVGAQVAGNASRGEEAPQLLEADQVVVALGSWSPQLVRPLGVRLAIYPTKGYSATLDLLRPDAAAQVSLLDDARKIAISRLGPQVRIAGTAEMAGYDTRVDTAAARQRCAALVTRFEQIFPGVASSREPRFWAGLRPSTPSNVPYIGRAPGWPNLWLNTGHGTLGWTHGAGSGLALAELMHGKRPQTEFRFLGG